MQHNMLNLEKSSQELSSVCSSKGSWRNFRVSCLQFSCLISISGLEWLTWLVYCVPCYWHIYFSCFFSSQIPLQPHKTAVASKPTSKLIYASPDKISTREENKTRIQQRPSRASSRSPPSTITTAYSPYSAYNLVKRRNNSAARLFYHQNYKPRVIRSITKANTTLHDHSLQSQTTGSTSTPTTNVATTSLSPTFTTGLVTSQKERKGITGAPVILLKAGFCSKSINISSFCFSSYWNGSFNNSTSGSRNNKDPFPYYIHHLAKKESKNTRQLQHNWRWRKSTAATGTTNPKSPGASGTLPTSSW